MNIMIVFLILHYGEHSVTEACIKSIQGLGLTVPHEVLIVDNDPIPGSWDNPHVVKTGNVGFSEANNLGYAYAKTELKASMVIACNNDLLFDAAGLPEDVLTSYVNGDAYVVSPDIEKVGTGEHQSPIAATLRTESEVRKTISLNNIALALYPVAYPFMKKGLKGATQLGVAVKGDESVIVPCGACIIFTKKYVEREEKLFEPETKFYYEEYILALRCSRRGYKIAYEPKLHVMHVDGAATAADTSGDYARIRTKMRNITDAAKVYLKFLKSSGLTE